MKRTPHPKPPATLAEKTVGVEFMYESPTAKMVCLAGDFNNWSFNRLPMRKDENGVWRLHLSLTTGRHEYRYVVDDAWQNGSCAGRYAPNEFGSCHCMVEAVA